MSSPNTQVRNLGLEPRLVRAIEELQRAAKAPEATSLSSGALQQVRAFIDAGGGSGGGGGGTDSGVPDLSPPPALEGFEAVGGFGIVLLRWTPSVDRRYGYAEIFRSATNNRGTAVLIGTAGGSMYLDELQDDQTRYYWIRPVNRWDSAVKGPFTPDSTMGVAATTAPNVEYLLELLTGEITASALHASLTSRIDLIDAPNTTPGSVNARIKVEQDARAAGDTALATTISALAVSSDAGFDWAKIWYFDTNAESWTSNGGSPSVSGGLLRAFDHATDPQLISPTGLAITADSYPQVKARIKKTGSPTWQGVLYWKRTGDATWDVGRSVTISEPTFTSGFASAIWSPTWDGTIDQIRIDLAASSDGTDRIEVDWVAIGRSAPGASVAQVTDLAQTRIGYCSIGGATTDYADKASCEAAGGTWNVGLPLATAVRQVAIDDGEDTLALEERFVAQRTLDNGLLGQWTIKVDANGNVGGIGLSADVPEVGPSTINFGVVADRFWVVAPESGAGTYPPNAAAPFYVLTTPTTIDGVEIDPGVYINELRVRNAAIRGAQIANATITDANIASLNAFKITVDSLVGRLATIDTGQFGTIFANKAFITAANIVDGSITNAKIGNVIQSDNFGATTGWQINKSGTAIFRNIQITDAAGNIVLASGSGIPWDQIIGDKTFSDTFSSIGKWADVQGAGAEVTLQQTLDAVTGGSVLRIGNNSGNDYAYVVCDKLVPFDATALYRVRARIRRLAGSGTVIVGFVGIGATGLMVNLNGSNSIANQHFFGSSGGTPASSWTLFEGYFRGYGAGLGTGTPTDPYGVHPLVRWMKPLVAANSLNQTGITEIDDFEITIVDGALATLDRISQSNASTYIEAGAIGTLQIASQIFSNDWVSSGGTEGWLINKDGTAVFNDVLVRGTVMASLLANVDFGRYIDLRPGAPSGYLLNFGVAQILADGSTRFNNKVAEGTVTINQYLESVQESVTVYAGDGSAPGTPSLVSQNVTRPLRVIVDTQIPYFPGQSLGVFQPLAMVTGASFLTTPGPANILAANFDTVVRVGSRQPQLSNSNGTAINGVSPAIGGFVTIEIDITWASATDSISVIAPFVNSVSWELYRIT